MAFFDRIRRNELPLKQSGLLASNRKLLDQKPEIVKFYEFEAAIVLDVVLDETHPILTNKTIVVNNYHKNLDGTNPKKDDKNYGWIGCIKFRFINTDVGVPNNQLRWAFPLENTGMTEIPLVNETVSVVEYFGNFYYTRKINLTGEINASAQFTLEPYYGSSGESVREFGTVDEFVGITSEVNISPQGSGKLGKIFKFNPSIRSLKRYEGDTIVESRFGSSIRFGGYGSDKSTNEADSGYENYMVGTGNPWMLIRNRQADADSSNNIIKHPKTYVTESINNDGSSIHLTSGKTESEFKTTCKKIMLRTDSTEEQSNFSPEGFTSFKYPKLDGDQIIINSDRLIFQSRGQEFFQYAKKRFSIVTDDEYTVDAHKQIVLTTNGPATINSPLIFLGEANQTGEPALLGRTTTDWMMAVCEWLSNTCDWQIELCDEWLAKHVHDTSKDPTSSPTPDWVSKMSDHVSAMQQLQTQIQDLKNMAPQNMSQRVFLVGGGTAPGSPGKDLAS